MSKTFWNDESYESTRAEIVDIKKREVVRSVWYLRLWFIRHIRALRMMYLINAHYDRWASMGAIGWNAASDYKIARAIWDGKI